MAVPTSFPTARPAALSESEPVTGGTGVGVVGAVGVDLPPHADHTIIAATDSITWCAGRPLMVHLWGDAIRRLTEVAPGRHFNLEVLPDIIA